MKMMMMMMMLMMMRRGRLSFHMLLLLLPMTVEADDVSVMEVEHLEVAGARYRPMTDTAEPAVVVAVLMPESATTVVPAADDGAEQ